MKTSKERFAQMIDGREYPLRLTKDEIEIAKANNLVILFGSSDDLIEAEGIFSDEVGAYDGGIVYLTDAGFEDLPDADEQRTIVRFGNKWKPRGVPVKIEFKKDGWKYQLPIPSATFKIQEDEEVYGEGHVICIDDIRVHQDGKHGRS